MTRVFLTSTSRKATNKMNKNMHACTDYECNAQEHFWKYSLFFSHDNYCNIWSNWECDHIFKGWLLPTKALKQKWISISDQRGPKVLVKTSTFLWLSLVQTLATTGAPKPQLKTPWSKKTKSALKQINWWVQTMPGYNIKAEQKGA